MNAYDIRAVAKTLTELSIKQGMTDESAVDELLHVIEGELSVTVLSDSEPVHETLPAGSVFIVPRGLWHRTSATAGTVLLFATAAEKSEHSWAEDPRATS